MEHNTHHKNRIAPWRRIVAGCVGLFAAANGASMLLAPATWFQTVPGVVDTGPYNPHLVLDVGFAFIAAGTGLLLFAWRSSFRPAAQVGSTFLGLHGLLHLYTIISGHNQVPVFDLAAVVLPAGAAVAASWPLKNQSSRRRTDA